MRNFAVLLAGAGLFACNQPDDGTTPDGEEMTAAAMTYEGADYGDDEAAKLAHGERMANVMLCTTCHTAEMTGFNMGTFDPELDGIWASNVTLAAPNLSDEQLETLLREGVHPTKEAIYMMPSKVYQKLSQPDMDAIIAYVRSLEPTGEPTPDTVLNEGLAGAAAAGQFKTSAEEVAEYVDKHPPDPGKEYALGRYIATTNCADCHGHSLTGEGGFAPALSDVLPAYDEAALTKLLTTGAAPEGREPGLMSFIGGNVASHLTETERAALVDYLKALPEAQEDTATQ